MAAAQADIAAELTGIAEIQAGVSVSPPTLSGQIEAAAQLVAALEAQLALSLSLGLPTVTVDLTVMLAAQAQLQAQLAVLLELLDAMATAGVAVIVQSGDADNWGPEMQERVSQIAPSGNAVQSVTFLATEPAVFAALGKVLLTG